MVESRSQCPKTEWLNHEPIDRALVGGKGSSLSQLASLGAPVPAAFALTTYAYRDFAATLDIPVRASDVEPGDLAAIRARINSAQLPSELREIVAREFETLKCATGAFCGCAVRSSATSEDSADFSFAGLHDTILDVRDLPALERAITQCWASLWSDRAVSYRRAGDIATEDDALAVVVQALIRSDVSFVVFTADPVNHREHHLVIAATWGLGEAVVSGLVEPDHIVIGPDGTLVDYVVGEKLLMVIPGGGQGEGVREVPVPRALQRVPVMSPARAESVGAIARDLSSRLGFHADIEGALAGDVLYLFQARPITTLRASVLQTSPHS